MATHTLNHFRPMLLLNLEEGFVLTGVDRLGDDGPPYLHLERSLERLPIDASPEWLRTEGPTQVASLPLRASAALADLVRQGFEVVGTRITPEGEHAVLERNADGAARFPDPF